MADLILLIWFRSKLSRAQQGIDTGPPFECNDRTAIGV